MRKRQIIIDCDPGLDDAVALLAAFAASDMLDLVGITTVAGNVRAELTQRNARIIRELAGRGREIPVCAGAPAPLLRDAVTAEAFHGSTGLGNIAFPRPRVRASRAHAVNFLIRTLRAGKGFPLTLVMTGPMTNLALALSMAPDITEGLEEIVVMGGADSEGGNITPYAEFNVFADPHAAAAVFRCGVAMRVLNLDVTHQIRTSDDQIARVRALGSKQAVAAADLLAASNRLEESAKGREAPLHDPSTILCLLRPDLFEGRQATVRVVTEEGERFGQTVPDYREDGHVLWYNQADADAVFSEMLGQIARYGE
ncbi:nucleoside hydrolase [Henriciella aquimarina]|uniref:nucleoside hydrolase n=1 Tax=Henriciella aquimarina TaxID=545261 RepID=UPI000A04CCB2|nr:nucleoside hydrolase [Henriciella aquimarina]